MRKKLDDELIESIAPKIYRHLVKIGANSEDAKDIVQDTLYKAVLYIDSIDPDRVSAWLFRVAINEYYDLCRKQNRQVQVSVEDIQLEDDQTPETLLMDMETKSQVTQTLDGLSVTQKHLLILKYEQNLSYEEISTLLGIPGSTVATYLYRAKQKFRQAYKEAER